MTYLAVPISGRDSAEAGKQIASAVKAGAEMLELRTDYLERLSPALVNKLIGEARAATKGRLLLIVTCRDKAEGGANDWPLDLRSDVLAEALNCGVDFVDCEWGSFSADEAYGKLKAALSANPHARLILSSHSFDGPFPCGLQSLYSEIRSYPNAIPKLVFKANHINDCFEAFDLLNNKQGDAIVLCMGQGGLISRILAKKLGGLLTFASIDESSATAPGQLTIEQLRKLYCWESTNTETELYGVIGWPVGHSLSPAIHNAGFKQIGANKLYVPLLIEGGRDEFCRFMDNILSRPWLGFRGVSITIPHKENALAFVKANGGHVGPVVEKIGALNTLLIDSDGKLRAYNTDLDGALNAITSKMGISRAEFRDMPVAVIGAGGVARTIVAGLSDAGAAVKIYNRTVDRAEKVAAEFGCSFASLDALPGVDAKLVVNCTSIGMHPNVDATVLPKEYIKQDMAVFDTVYNPQETLLLKHAREVGATTIEGLSMFINQAVVQFKLFTGQGGDANLMRKTSSGELGR